MAKKLFFENRLSRIHNRGDGMRHLAVSVIQHAIVDADEGDRDAVLWLLNSTPPGEKFILGGGIYLAGFAGLNKEATREALCLKYGT